MNIPGVLEQILETLRDAGMDADVDPRNLNPPCAWVSARSIPTTGRFMCGDRTMSVDIYLISPDTGALEAYKHLNTMLDMVLGVLDVTGEIDLAEVVTLSGNGGPLPAFRLTIETST